MKVYIAFCTTPHEEDLPIFGVYSTKALAYENANKILKKLGYDDTKWNGDCRGLEKDGYYQGYAYITEFEVDKNLF